MQVAPWRTKQRRNASRRGLSRTVGGGYVSRMRSLLVGSLLLFSGVSVVGAGQEPQGPALIPARPPDAPPPTTTPEEPQPKAPPMAPAEDAPADLNAVVTSLVREHLPHQYEDTRHWGKTKEVFAGIKVRVDGWQVKTKRRKRTVNHGTWKLYRIELIDPHQTFQIQVDKIAPDKNGRVGMDARCQANLRVFGRVSQWEFGVQLASFSIDATARVQLLVHGNLGLRLDNTKLPPDVVLDPKVTWADIQLLDFRVHKISDLQGPLVRELGKGIREVLEDKLAENRDKLPEKMNRQIDKNKDRLRLSLHDLIQSSWKELEKYVTK